MAYPQLNYGIDAGALGNVWQPPMMMADAGLGAGYFSGRPTQRPAYPDYYFPGYGSDVTGDYIRKTFGPWYGAEKADTLAQTPWVRDMAMAPVVSFSGGPDMPSPLAQAMQTDQPGQALAQYDRGRMGAGGVSPTQGRSRPAEVEPLGGRAFIPGYAAARARQAGQSQMGTQPQQLNLDDLLRMMSFALQQGETIPLTQRIAALGGKPEGSSENFLSGILKGLFKGSGSGGGGAVGGDMMMGL